MNKSSEMLAATHRPRSSRFLISTRESKIQDQFDKSVKYIDKQKTILNNYFEDEKSAIQK